MEQREYLVIEDGKVWTKIMGECGATGSVLMEELKCSYPKEIERIKQSVIRTNLNSQYQVLK